jgi:hypothetical protein
MAKKYKTRLKEDTRRFGRTETSLPKYRHGDYLRVDLSFGAASSPIALWICVDHCSEKCAIVFGTIDSEPEKWLGKALTLGEKLAVSYRSVQECRPVW